MRFAFVVGVPRSGTTMIGALLGSHPDVYAPGEYFAFYATEMFLKRPLRRVPSALREEWFEALDAVSVDLAARAAERHDATIFCDATPWNLTVAESLVERFTDAVFVLCLRHPAGVIQSLERSFRGGYLWAGADDRHRADLYASLYGHVAALPEERTVVFDYDALCGSPAVTVPSFIARAGALLGIGPDGCDPGVLVETHAAAPVRGSGAPIAMSVRNGRLRYRPRASYDAARWAEQRTAEIDDLLAPVLTSLAVRYPESRMFLELA